jgi:hypothetical protein
VAAGGAMSMAWTRRVLTAGDADPPLVGSEA